MTVSAEPIKPTRAARISRFIAALALVGIVWLIVLPWLGRRPAIRRYRDWLAERRIDPSAMYYTELESMEPILDRLNRRMRDGRGGAATGSGRDRTPD